MAAAIILLLILKGLVGPSPEASIAADAPEIVQVYPSGEEVPENLLRISIEFKNPVVGPVLSQFSLFSGDKKIIKPFLDQELWSPDGCRLTILLEPGRVKTGLVLHDRFGRPLHLGERVSLVLDGKLLKSWRVTQAVRVSPDPKRWRIVGPRILTREPLIVNFNAPIDAQDVDYICVVGPDGNRVRGQAKLVKGEVSWVLIPDRGWQPGAYELLVYPNLEDSAGNSISEPFEERAGTASEHTGSPSRLFLLRS